MVSLSLHSALSGVPASVLEGALVILPRARPFPAAGAAARAGVGAAAPGVDHRRNLRAARRPRAGLADRARRRDHHAAARGDRGAPRRARAARRVALGRARGRAGRVGRRPGRPRRDRRGDRAGLPHGGGGAAASHPRPVVAGGSRGDVGGRHRAACWLGPGYHETAVLAAAQTNFHGPRFTGARLGGTTIGYPDLFLAALLGASLAGERAQVWAAGARGARRRLRLDADPGPAAARHRADRAHAGRDGSSGSAGAAPALAPPRPRPMRARRLALVIRVRSRSASRTPRSEQLGVRASARVRAAVETCPPSVRQA